MASDANGRNLRLVKKPAKPAEPRNYWNTSGKNAEFFPTEPRADSIPVLNKHGRVIQEPADKWWINSKEHNYCFWSYIRSQSQPDGTMEPLLQSEIAKLFGCSSTKVHFMLRQAMKKLKSKPNRVILEALLELTQDDPEEGQVSPSNLAELDSSDEDSVE